MLVRCRKQENAENNLELLSPAGYSHLMPALICSAAGRLIRSLSLVLIAALAILFSHPSQAKDEPPARIQTWRAKFPNGEYAVALHAITSVSTHEYVVDGVARVYELTIDTHGSATARIYCIDALASTPGGIGEATVANVREKLNEVRERLDTAGVTNAVAKNYPATTHARTIEYRVDSREQVDKLFKSAYTAWTRGTAGEEKVKD